jgi:transketolase
MPPTIKTRMRDAFIMAVTERMESDPTLFFLSADFGSPKLDILSQRFPERFINVGIAEQNLITVAAGLALEGHAVVAYAIAPFLSMRCYEQVRVNLCLLSQVRPMKVTLAGVGAGYSYDVSGPTHQALEDLSIMRVLPNLGVYSPADSATARALAELLLSETGIRYLRMDGKELPDVAGAPTATELRQGFRLVRNGQDVMLVATGYMVHKALEAADLLAQKHGLQAGVVDIIALAPLDGQALTAALTGCPAILSVEEGFVGKGGLDAALRELLWSRAHQLRFKALGLPHHYRFDIGGRDTLLAAVGLGAEQLAAQALALLAP